MACLMFLIAGLWVLIGAYEDRGSSIIAAAVSTHRQPYSPFSFCSPRFPKIWCPTTREKGNLFSSRNSRMDSPHDGFCLIFHHVPHKNWSPMSMRRESGARGGLSSSFSHPILQNYFFSPSSFFKSFPTSASVHVATLFTSVNIHLLIHWHMQFRFF